MTKSSDMEATRSIGNEARSTRPLRVHNEGSFWLWFVLPGFLVLLGGIIATQGKGSGATIGLLVCVTLAIIVLAYGVFGAKRWTDFDDEIVVQYLLKQRRICWEDVSFVSFEEHRGKVRTGIPFVHVPVTTALAPCRCAVTFEKVTDWTSKLAAPAMTSARFSRRPPGIVTT